MTEPHNPLNTRDTLGDTGRRPRNFFGWTGWKAMALGRWSGLPFSMRVLLEAALRHLTGIRCARKMSARWRIGTRPIPIPSRYRLSPRGWCCKILRACRRLVDLAALRSAMGRVGGNPKRIEPLIPADLVVDHSVQVDSFANSDALQKNAKCGDRV